MNSGSCITQMVEQPIKNLFLPNQNENEEQIQNSYFKNEIPNRLIQNEQKEEKNHARVSSKKIRTLNNRFVFAPVTLTQPWFARATFDCVSHFHHLRNISFLPYSVVEINA